MTSPAPESAIPVIPASSRRHRPFVVASRFGWLTFPAGPIMTRHTVVGGHDLVSELLETRSRNVSHQHLVVDHEHLPASPPSPRLRGAFGGDLLLSRSRYREPLPRCQNPRSLRFSVLPSGREPHALLLDLTIVAAYFLGILLIGLRARVRKDVTPDQYFLSSRSLRWPSIALSTIATNIFGGPFHGYGGLCLPLRSGSGESRDQRDPLASWSPRSSSYPSSLRQRVTTITQFFESKLGPQVALMYSVFMITLYAFIYLGSALFWASYAIDGLFGPTLGLPVEDTVVRLFAIAVALAAFSAFYTYLGGLRAVVRTDIAQFVLFLGGGLVVVFLAIHELGGWSELWTRTGSLMHLHLPRDHPTLPWIGLFGMNLLNLNYWGANQVILQRALAARDLRQAQIGLLVGGALKYLITLIVVIPGIALAGLRQGEPLQDPDQAYLTLVRSLLPVGLRGLVLCGLFASLMSTVDSIYNSVSTMVSIDLYKRYWKPEATDSQIIRAARITILGTMLTGLLFAYIMISASSKTSRSPSPTGSTSFPTTSKTASCCSFSPRSSS